MKRRLLFFLFHLFFMSSYAQTDDEIIQAAQQKEQLATYTLDTVYQSVLKKYKSDGTFISNLKHAQMLWLDFLRLEINMRFPVKPDGFYKKLQPSCYYNYKAELTNERISRLRQWLVGTADTICAGSIKVQH